MIQYKNSKKDIQAEPHEQVTDDHHDTVKAKPVVAHNHEVGNRCPYGGCGLSQSDYGWSGWQYPAYHQGSYSYIPQMTPMRDCPGCNRLTSRRSADISSEVAEEVDLEESNDKQSFRSVALGRQFRGKQVYPSFRMDSNIDQGMLDFDYENDESILDHQN